MARTFAGFGTRDRPPGSARRLMQLRPGLQQRLETMTAAVREPFVGITAEGKPVPGLFPVRGTGVSTQPLLMAADAYLEALTPEQRAGAVFSVDDAETWRSWSNIHPFMLRHGVCLEELSEAQRDLALAIVRETFSASGYQCARGVMKLNDYIGEITEKYEEYGEWVYWLSIMGTPSPDEPWGWQIDGHHLNVNCFVLKDQLVMTPCFMGSEPVTCDEGKHAGTRVFQTEESMGLAFMGALTPEQRAKAIIGAALPSETAGFHDNDRITYEGIRHDELSGEQQGRLLSIIEQYVGRMRPGHARVRMDEVQSHLAGTHFAWAGDHGADSVFYYRVYNPVILIEFEHQAGIALDNDQPTRNHIHTVVRTPNGNDYGMDLLRQHHAQYGHVDGAHVPR